MSEFIPVERTVRGEGGHASRTPIRRANDRYDYAPVTHPQIGQNTLVCRDCGSLVYSIEDHDAFHALIDSLINPVLNPPAAPEKVTEPHPTSSRAKKVAE